MKTLAILLVAAGCVFAATADEVDRLAMAARSVPPEFGADVMLRLAAMDGLPPARRMELIGQAFERASESQPRYSFRPAFGASASAGFVSKAYAQNLDALDLGVRAVEAMSTLDAAKARDLFQKIPALDLPKLKCDSWMAYDVEPYYREMASLAGKFSEAERKSGLLLRFLEPHAGAIHSAVEAGPMAETLGSAPLSDAELQALVRAFAGALGKISGDDRSFSSSNGLGTRIEALAAECSRRKISPLPLLEGYRLFLVTNLTGARCLDDVQMAGMAASALADVAAARRPDNMVSFFNERLLIPPLQPIQEQEATPSHLEGTAVGLRGCEDAACRALTEQYRVVMLAPPAERSGAEWMARLKKLLAALDQWQPGKTDAAAHFREKATAYGELLSVTVGEARQAVAFAELDYVLHSRNEAANSIEWFLPLNRLLAWTVLDPAAFAGLREKLRQSDDPVVALYSRLEAVVPRRPEQLMRLM